MTSRPAGGTARSIISPMMLVLLLLLTSCDPKDAKPAWHQEVSQLRPKVEKLGEDIRLAQWVEVADQLRGSPFNKLRLMDKSRNNRLIVGVGDRVYHSSLEDPTNLEEVMTSNKVTLNSDKMDTLTKEIGSLQNRFQDLGVEGFERSEDGEIVYLYLEPKIIIVVLRDGGEARAREQFDRFAHEGQDPRGDVVKKIGARVYGMSERR